MKLSPAPRLHRRRLLVAVALALLAALRVAVSLAATAPANVIGLAALSDGRLALLDRERGLFLADPRDQTMRTLVPSFGLHSPMDVISRRTPTGEQLFVTVHLRSSSTTSARGRLQRYGLDGKLGAEWLANAGEELSGVQVSADGRTAYLANARQPVVHRLDISRSRSLPARLALVRDGEAFGALALDAKRQRLLVADAYQGAVYQVRLDGTRSSLLFADLGEPYALAVDAAGDRLLIADADDARVLVADLASTAKPRVFATVKGLERPHALAVAADGSVWVADHRTATLFQLSRTGSLLRSFRPKVVQPAARR